jgi:competence protein ComEA
MNKSVLSTLIAASALVATSVGAAPVNVNSASAEEIAQALNGVGFAKAQAIVDYRKANGPFKSPQDLTAVRGIGTRTVEQNAKDIQL